MRLASRSGGRFFDGVDDFIFLAIDLDRSGVPGDSDEEVLINSPPSLNFINTAIGAPFVEADFKNVAQDGEWFAMEVNLSEDATRIGQNGMLFWDALDDDDQFRAWASAFVVITRLQNLLDQYEQGYLSEDFFEQNFREVFRRQFRELAEDWNGRNVVAAGVSERSRSAYSWHL